MSIEIAVMAKISFTLDAWLKDKSQKIETRSGKNVRIVCWDKIGVPIIALVGDAEDIVTYNRDGTTGQQMSLPSDLFIITPEPELTEFEKKLFDIIGYAISLSIAEPKKPTSEFVKEYAAELLALARKQLIEEQYTSDPRKTDLYKLGKAEALKDLPRWENVKIPPTEIAKVWVEALDSFWLHHKNKKILVQSLEKLPGFKEDSHE